MPSPDWIVIGRGLTGAALAYELQRLGYSTLLVERAADAPNATRFSYGGIPYWAGTTPAMQQLGRESLARHRYLSEELGADTQFREIELLLTLGTQEDPAIAAAPYAACAIPPHLLSPSEAATREPLLDPDAIGGALSFPHACVHPQALADAYCSAHARLGGKTYYGEIVTLVGAGGGIAALTAQGDRLAAGGIIVCAGGFSRELLAAAGHPIRLYYTHAAVIATAPSDLTLHTLVMPATLSRNALESATGSAEADALWNERGRVIAPMSLDAGAIQFRDRTLRLGQISHAIADPHHTFDPVQSETALRAAIARVLPALATVPGTCRHCLVAFSGDGLPLLGSVPGFDRAYVFSGFTGPFAFVPPLAQRFAAVLTGARDEIVAALSPSRFAS